MNPIQTAEDKYRPSIGNPFEQPLPFVFGKGRLLARRVLILGTGRLAGEVWQAIRIRKPWLMEVVGFVDRKLDRAGNQPSGGQILGTYDQLTQLVAQHEVNTIVVCIEDRRATLPLQTLLALRAIGVEVVDGHHMYEIVEGRLSIDALQPSALIFSRGFRRRALSILAKRLADISLALGGIVVLSPLLLLIAILIKLDSPGPVIYRQLRVGLGGKPYLIWKFRSMRQDAEQNGPQWAKADDARVSKVGWWLRKIRLDELPQLINVLKGEMSLVGPRPERPVFVQDLRVAIPYYDLRHTVRPGITGWAQVKYRYGASLEDSHTKLQYDLFYVKHCSFSLDCLILLKTVAVVCFGKGAR